MSDLVGNHEDRFSCDLAHMKNTHFPSIISNWASQMGKHPHPTTLSVCTTDPLIRNISYTSIIPGFKLALEGSTVNMLWPNCSRKNGRNLSCNMRLPAFCLCENNAAIHLHIAEEAIMVYRQSSTTQILHFHLRTTKNVTSPDHSQMKVALCVFLHGQMKSTIFTFISIL